MKKITAIAFFVILISGCSNPATEKKEDAADYYVSEYFKAEIVSPKIARAAMITAASKERLAHGDKEGGIIKFIEDGKVWGYVEYHYPENPAKANAVDDFKRNIEVKIY